MKYDEKNRTWTGGVDEAIHAQAHALRALGFEPAYCVMNERHYYMLLSQFYLMMGARPHDERTRLETFAGLPLVVCETDKVQVVASAAREAARREVERIENQPG